jgi:hypothetical protein
MIINEKSLNISKDEAMASVRNSLTIIRDPDEFTTEEYAKKYKIDRKVAYNELCRGEREGILARRKMMDNRTNLWKKR